MALGQYLSGVPDGSDLNDYWNDAEGASAFLLGLAGRVLPLAFFENKNIKKIKIKNDVILSLFESMMESFTVQDFFFSLLISATQIFYLKLCPTQTQLLS